MAADLMSLILFQTAPGSNFKADNNCYNKTASKLIVSTYNKYHDSNQNDFKWTIFFFLIFCNINMYIKANNSFKSANW